MIAMFRGNDSAEWENQTHPLVIVFHNYALEGSSLENIHAGYDATQGNILHLASSVPMKVPKIGEAEARGMIFMPGPLNLLKIKLRHTQRNLLTGRGWRMAVILNGKHHYSPT